MSKENSSMLPAIYLILASVIVSLSYGEKTAAPTNSVPIRSFNGSLHHISNLCVGGDTKTCTAITLAQVISTCEASITLKYNVDKPTVLNLTKIATTECKEDVCRVKVDTDRHPIYEMHLVMECKQGAGTTAACTCVEWRALAQ
uniref:Uncharacterized protein n=1 Tax=Cacopsylla melanoneura TaxID=428564 RepID=A0A8D8VQN8_9HEMI